MVWILVNIINQTNKKAFQLNANRLLSDFMVNKFRTWGWGWALYNEVQVEQVWTCQWAAGTRAMYGGPKLELDSYCEQTDTHNFVGGGNNNNCT